MGAGKAGAQYRLISGSLGAHQVSQQVPVPVGLSGACGWDELDPVSGHFQNLQFELVWWAYVQGILGSG